MGGSNISKPWRKGHIFGLVNRGGLREGESGIFHQSTFT